MKTALFTWLKFTCVDLRSQKRVSGNQPLEKWFAKYFELALSTIMRLHETYETMKPLTPRKLWNYETIDTTKPMKPWNTWDYKTIDTTKPRKPRNHWHHETMKHMKLWTHWHHEHQVITNYAQFHCLGLDLWLANFKICLKILSGWPRVRVACDHALSLFLCKACFKRRATAMLSWLDWSSTAARH